MILYLAGALVVFTTLLHSFIKDDTTPKSHVLSWIFIGLATAVWPIVLPSIVRKKFSKVSLTTISLPEEEVYVEREI
jgi:cyanate permease